jgi:hypothetical protein
MNRQERRKQDRELNKNVKAINSLTPAQTQLIDIVAKQRGKEFADMYIAEFSEIMDRNFTAAMLVHGLPLADALEIERLLSELSIEDTEKYKKLKEEGDFIMVAKKYETQVREAAERLIKEGVEKKCAIEELAYQFPKLSKSMLLNMYARVEEEFKAPKKEDTDPDVQEALEYIFDEEQKPKDSEVKEILEQADKIAEEIDDEPGNKPEVDKKEESPKLVKIAQGQNQALLKLEEMQVVFKSEDNTYTLTKDKIAISISEEDVKVELSSEHDFLEYLNGVSDYYNRLLNEANYAYSKWNSLKEL